MTETFFAAHQLGDIARYCADRGYIGELNHRDSNEQALRFGTGGSLKVVIAGPEKGTWFSHELKRGGGVLDFLELFLDLKGKAAFDWLKDEMGIVEEEPRPKGKKGNAPLGHIVATYDYHDEQGKLLFQVVRFAPKGFKQRRPDGQGWTWNLKGVERVPYHLPDLDKGGRIYICEGEKDCDRLRAWGVIATTSPMGAEYWLPRWNRYFTDAEVVIVPDNDEAGARHASKIAKMLLSQVAIKPTWVKIVELSGLPEAGDLSDALDQGLSQGEFEDLVDSTEPLAWGDPRLGGTPPPGSGHAPLFVEQRLADIVMRPVEWLWPGRFARGKISLIAGHPGLGKSTVSLDLAAHISTGIRWPDGGTCPQGRVLIFSLEDDPADTIKPRLVAAGVKEDMVELVYGVPATAEDGTEFVRPFSIREDVERLRQRIVELGDVVAIIIDPINAYLGNDGEGRMIDSHNTAEVRAVLDPFAKMASDTNTAIIGISHLRKSLEGDAILSVLGALGFVATARAVYFNMADLDDPGRRLLLPAKNNLAEDRTGFAYRLRGHHLETGPTTTVEWENDVIEHTADQELAARRKAEKRQKDPNRNRLETEFVKVELEDGTVSLETLFGHANDAGITKAKVRAVLNELGVVHVLMERNPNVWGVQLP